MKILVDADLPRSTSKIIRELGFECADVRDIDLYRATDSEIFDYAFKHGFVIITKDSDFVELARFSAHNGIIHVRLPYYFTSEKLNYYIKEVLRALKPEEIFGAICVITLNKIRIRK